MALLVTLHLGALLGAGATTAPPSTLLLLLAPAVPAAPQSAFSPFSLLGSFFSSSPPWAKVAPTPRRKPQKVFFRPHHPVPPKGPTFSASQQVPQIVRLHQRPTPKHSLQPRTPSPPRPPPPRRHPQPLSPISPTQIIRITSPSNFSAHPPPPTTPAPSPPAQTTRAALQGIVSNSVDNAFLTIPEQVELVYPSNSALPDTAPPVTEQSAFSSFPSRESELSGPNPEDFPIISLIDQGPGRHYYDEVFHLGVRAPPAPQPSPVVLGLQPFGAYYSQEEFTYNQDPIDLELVHGSGPQARDVLGANGGTFVSGGGTFVNNEIEDTGVYTEARGAGSDTATTTSTASSSAVVRLEPIPSPAPLVASTTTLRDTTAASTSPVPSLLPTSTAPPFTASAPIVDLPDPTAASSTSYSSFTSSFASFASNPSLASIPSTLSTFTAFSPPSAPPPSPGLPSPRGRPQSGDFSPDFTTLQSGAEARRVRLVNTIEYRPEEEARSRTGRTDVRSNSSVSSTILPAGLGVGAQLAECGAGAEAGWCPVSGAYPARRAVQVETGCPAVLEAYRAVVSEDLDLLGDNSPSVISSERDRQRPWSWKVYAYKKQQVCSSELHFTQPGLALDTEGVWRVILQTETLRQRVALDMCHAPDSPCPGVADCGRKSRCVQRYNYQMLLALTEGAPCPALRAFRLPSGCVCHAETQGDQQGDQGFFF